MTKYNEITNTFAAGALSPKAHNRSDLKEYNLGLEEMFNFVPATTGGAFRRMGSEFLVDLAAADADWEAHDVTVIPFRGTTEDFFIVIKVPNEINKNYRVGEGTLNANPPIRIFSRRRRNQLTVTGNYYEHSVVFPDYTTSSTSVGINSGSGTDRVLFGELCPYFYYLSDTDKLNIDGFRYVQFGDDLIITHSSGTFAPMVISFFQFFPALDLYHFHINAYVYKGLSPFDWGSKTLGAGGAVANDTVRRLVRATPIQTQNTESNITYNIVAAQNLGVPQGQVVNEFLFSKIEAKDSAGTRIPSHFNTGHIGTIISVTNATAASEGLMYVTGIDTTVPAGEAGSVVDGIIVIGFSATSYTPSFRWAHSSFSPITGFPRAIGFYQGRLHYSSTISEPVNTWASSTFDLGLMRTRVLSQDILAEQSQLLMPGPYDASYSFGFTLLSKTISGINWLIDDDADMRLGTPEQDFILTFDRGGASGYGRDNKEIRPQSGFGSSNIQPVYADAKVLYTNLDASRIRAINTKSRELKYLNTDLTILADHMRYHSNAALDSSSSVNSSYFRQVYWQNDSSTLWCVNSEGALVGLTLDSTLGVSAWHTHNLGGSNSVQAICSAFNGDSRFEDLIVITRREVNGVSKAYIESIGEVFNHIVLNTDDTTSEQDTEDKVRYVDCFLKKNQASSVTITGLSHLEGETTLSAFYNGIYEENITVTAGVATLAAATTEVLIGYKYSSTLKTLNLDRGQQYGSSRGNISRVDRVTISLYNSSTGDVADEEESFNSMELDESALYTGDIRHDLSQSPDREPKIVIQTDKPLPLNVLGITTRGVSYDG